MNLGFLVGNPTFHISGSAMLCRVLSFGNANDSMHSCHISGSAINSDSFNRLSNAWWDEMG